MAINRIEKKAYELLSSLKIKEIPLPVEKIAKKLNIRIQYEPFRGDLSGLLYRDGNETIIGVNSLHSITRQRFTIAHELGHYCLHQGDSVYIDRNFKINFRDSESSKAINPEEIEANSFAAAILMPEDEVIKEVNNILNNGIDLENDPKEIEKLARRFNVSQQALLIRLGKLNLL